MSSPSSDQNCANCRHHTARMAPKPHKDADELIDGSYFVVDDSDQKVYSCHAPKSERAAYSGTEIGPVPCTCDAWEAPKPAAERDTRMKELLAALLEGRRAWGAEVDPTTHARAVARIRAEHDAQPALFADVQRGTQRQLEFK